MKITYFCDVFYILDICLAKRVSESLLFLFNLVFTRFDGKTKSKAVLRWDFDKQHLRNVCVEFTTNEKWTGFL